MLYIKRSSFIYLNNN